MFWRSTAGPQRTVPLRGPCFYLGVNLCPFVVLPRSGRIGFNNSFARTDLAPPNDAPAFWTRQPSGALSLESERGPLCPRVPNPWFARTRLSALRVPASFTDLKSRKGTRNRRRSERILDCGGKRSATPLSHACRLPVLWPTPALPKAPSPLRSAGAVQKLVAWYRFRERVSPRRSPISVFSISAFQFLSP